MPNTITVAAPPNTNDFTAQVLATMQATSGVLTDYNDGSQLKTQTESIGAVVEQQGIWSQTIAFQALVYSAMALFGITPNLATAASGIVSFLTSQPPISGVPASQNVSIPQATIVATAGGFQFQTTQAALLAAGTSGVSVPVAALTGGIVGNVPASGVTALVTNLAYPLFVTNVSGTGGGSNAEAPAATLARFAAARAAIGLSSPGAIANSVIGVQASGTGETILYSTCYEPWIAAGSGAGSGVAAWTLYIDNGFGAASSGLITAATSRLNGGLVSGATNAGVSQGVGFRDAGVPYAVSGVSPIYAVVAVSGTVSSLVTTSVVNAAISGAVGAYFTLPFGTTAEQAQIAAATANSAQGLLTALSVQLMVSGSSTPVTGVGALPFQRVILGSLSIALTAGG